MGSRYLHLRVKRLLAALALLCAPAVVLAQPHPNDARGFTPESVYDFHDLDSVNVFNGNVTVGIPIGQVFKVNGSLSYRLSLAYNSHLWHFNDNMDANPPLVPHDTFSATPLRRFNAGLGWMITLGQLFYPLPEEQTKQAGHETISYMTSDGAEHGFFTSLHGEPAVDGYSYTRDSTYIRMRDRMPGDSSGSQTIRYVDLPDGTIQTFLLLQPQNGNWPVAVPNAQGSKWCLTQIADRFGNAANISYNTANGYSEIWTITDPARTITLYFVSGGQYFDNMIHHIIMPAPTGTAEWDFQTPSMQIPPGFGDTGTQPPRLLSIPVLTRIMPPAGNGYAMQISGQPAYSTAVDTPGVLTRLQLPTLGSIGWDYEQADFADGVADSPKSPAIDHPNVCVARKTYDAAGNVLGAWTYGRMWGAQAHCQYACANNGANNGDLCSSGRSRQLTGWVTEPPSTQPDGTQGPAITTFTYYSTYQKIPNPHGDSCDANAVTVDGANPTLLSTEYALPFTRFVTRDGRFLSTEVRADVDFSNGVFGIFSGAGRVPPTGTVLQTNWVTYEMDADGLAPQYGNDFNRRMTSSAAYFEDDNCGTNCAVFAASNLSNYDGFGHYRQTSTDGNFPTPSGSPYPARNNRTTFVNHMPDSTSWLLGSYTQKCVADDASLRSDPVSDCGALGGKTELASFDSHGVLVAKRDLINSGVALSNNDILTLYGFDGQGNLRTEQFYGGDVKASASTLSAFAGTGSPEYAITHDLTYTNGSSGAVTKAKSYFANGLVTSDADFDVPTGLTTGSRDSAGVATLYSYDVLGRAISVAPQGEAPTSYAYTDASFAGSLSPAHIVVSKTSALDGSIAREYQYDGLGRIWREKTLLPDSTWSAKQHEYDGRGTLIALSTPEIWSSDASFSPQHKTRYGFDQFNRPIKTVAPDGTETYTLHTGNRIVRKKLSPSDSALSLSTQYSDALGRLVRVEEPSGVTSAAQTTGATVTTDYRYDVADHLTNVSMQGAEGVTQTRTFQYDNRGFLTSEQHPELGPAGYGTTYYSLFDSSGHPGRKLNGAGNREFDLRYTYDGAERLTNVDSFDSTGLARPIKQFSFADSNDSSSSPTDYRAGKLLQAVRHNYLATIAGDVAVTESYRYATPAGRLSDRTTLIENIVSGAHSTMQQFLQTFTYSDLGHLNALGYPTCASSVSCAGSSPIGILALTHSNGALTAIPGYASSITYNPDGTVHTVVHGTNGGVNVTDTYTPDPNGMSRPASISFTGWQDCTLPAPALITTPASAVAGATGVTASVPNDPSVAYAWSINGGTITSGTSASSVVYSVGGAGSLTLTLRITNTCGTTTVTATVNVASCTDLSISAQPQDAFINPGQSHTLSVAAAAPPGTTTAYQWYAGLSGDTSHPISGATSSTYDTPSLSSTTQYWVRVTLAGLSCLQDSVTATVRVCQAPVIVRAPQSQSATLDVSANPPVPVSVTLSVVATGDNLTFAWYDAADTAQTVLSSTPTYTATYSGAASVGVHNYYVTVGGCGSTVRSDVSVTVYNCYTKFIMSPPMVSVPPNATVFTITISMYVDPSLYHYQWYHGIGSNAQPLPSSDSYMLTRTLSTPYDAFWCVVSQWATDSNGQVLRNPDQSPVVICSTTTPKSYAEVAGTCPLPQISVGPTNVVVVPGQQTTFTATADWPTVTYQWYVGSSGDTSTPIYGETRNSTTVQSLVRSYWVRVTDECGINHADSQTLTVSVGGCSPVVINQQPQSADAASGAATVLRVDANNTASPNSHTPLTYTWFQTGSTVPIGTNPQVTVHPTVTTSYYAQIGQDCNGPTTTNSLPATVHVRSCAGINVTEQPSNVTMVANTSASVHVSASSSDTISYQWYSGDNGVTSSPVSGGTLSSLTVSPSQTTSYWVRMTTSTCTIDSQSAVIKVCIPPQVSAIWGSNASLVRGQSTTLSIPATGTDLTYQWYIGARGDISSPINYATWNSITVTPQNTTTYWVRVTGLCGSQDSGAVTITVCAVPVITQQPQSVSIYAGGTATLTVTATDATTTPISYQWYRGLSGQASQPVGTNSPTFTTPPLVEETNYWVALTCDICGTASESATVSICPIGPSVTGPANQSIALGQTAHLVIPPFSPALSYTYFWYQGASGDMSHPLGDFGGDWGPYNYIDVSPAVTTQYWAQTKYGTCIASTATTTVSVCIPTITQQPAGIMINSGQTTTLTVAANTAGLTYQWYRGASGDTSAPVGTSSPSFTTPALTVTTSYWVKVTGTCGQSVNSNTATVTICQPPAITVQPLGAWLVRGQSTTLSVTATGTNLSYQWYLGASGNTSSPLAGNSPGLTVTAPPNPADYWVKITGTCGSVNSATAHISVCTTPTINTQPQSSYVFSGSSATLSVSASEATGEPMHYQWHRGTSSSVNVGTDSPSYNTGALTADTSYYVTVTAGMCSVDSAAATVSICMYPQSVPGAPNANTSHGQSVRLQLASNPGVTAYQWYRGASGDMSAPISGWQAANYVDVAPTTTTGYWAQWQANSGACISNTTTTTVTVCIPVITQQPANVTIASGSTTLSVASNLPGSTYQWYIGTSGTVTSPISGATLASVTVSPSSTTSYWCRVSGPCASVNSNTATVTICSPPAITHQPTTYASYSGQLNILAVTATGTNLTYQWYQGASGDTSHIVSGATSNSISAGPTSSVQYWVRVTGTCGSVNSAAAWMSVYPGIIQQPQQTNYLSQGSKGNLFVYAIGTGLHYQWWGDSGPVAGAPDSPILITPDITATSSFYCMVSSAGGATIQTWPGTFYLCDGVSILATTVTNPGGNCRYLIANISGSPDSISWYQGQRGDTSIPVGTGSYVYVCPSTSTTYWFRATNTDQNLQVSCYSDSPTVTVP